MKTLNESSSEVKYEVRCRRCKRIMSSVLDTSCEACGGLLDVLFSRTDIPWGRSESTLKRYKALLPVPDEFDSFPVHFSASPLIELAELARLGGVKCVIGKWEGANPSGSVKDREVGVSLALFSLSDIDAVVMASTGNTATAYLYALENKPGPFMHIFLGKTFRARVPFPDASKQHRIYIVDGTYDEVSLAAARFAQETGLRLEGGFHNIGLREGQKTLLFEVVEQLGNAPDWYFQAVSAALGVDGFFKANTESIEGGSCSVRSRIVAVQQDGCNPMVRAYEAGSSVWKAEFSATNPDGPAKGILRGAPSSSYEYVYQDVTSSKGAFVSVSTEDILHAMQFVAQDPGLPICAEAGVAVAGFLQMARQRRIPQEDIVLINLSGRKR